MITVWYLTWGLLLVPYRLVRRSARKRKLEALRHRELLGTIQGSAAASAAAIVAAKAASSSSRRSMLPTSSSPTPTASSPLDELRGHLLSGRLTSEEFEERVSAAQKARTRADLDAATIHLPRTSR